MATGTFYSRAESNRSDYIELTATYSYTQSSSSSPYQDFIVNYTVYKTKDRPMTSPGTRYGILTEGTQVNSEGQITNTGMVIACDRINFLSSDLDGINSANFRHTFSLPKTRGTTYNNVCFFISNTNHLIGSSVNSITGTANNTYCWTGQADDVSQKPDNFGVLPSLQLIAYTPYTNCQPPTSVSLDRNFIKSGETATLSWSGAIAGQNNPITGYRVYRNGSSHTSTSSTSCNVSAAGTYDVSTIGEASGYSSPRSSAKATLKVWSNVKINSLTPNGIGIIKVGTTKELNFKIDATAGDNNAITEYKIFTSSNQNTNNTGDFSISVTPSNYTPLKYGGSVTGTQGDISTLEIGTYQLFPIGYTLPTTYDIPDIFEDTLEITLPDITITHDSAINPEVRYNVTFYNKSTEVTSTLTELPSGYYTYSASDISSALGQEIEITIVPVLVLESDGSFIKQYEEQGVKQTSIIGVPAGHALKIVLSNDDNSFYNDVYNKSANTTLRNLEYNYTNYQWQLGDNSSFEDFKITLNTNLQISLSPLPDSITEGTRCIKGEILWNSNNNSQTINLTADEEGIATLNFSDYFNEDSFPKGKQIRIFLQSYYILNNLEFPHNVYDINLTFNTPLIPSIDKVNLQVTPIGNNIYDINANKKEVYYNGELISSTISLPNIKVLNIDGAITTDPSSYNGVGFKIVSTKTNLSNIESISETDYIITPDSIMWGAGFQGTEDTNYFYPNYTEDNNISQTLNINMLESKWHNGTNLIEDPGYYSINYTIIPINIYGYEGEGYNFSIKYDTRTEPTMIESPQFIIDGAPANISYNLGGLTKIRPFFQQDDYLLNGLSYQEKSWCLFKFKYAIDNNKASLYTDNVLNNIDEDPCSYYIVIESYRKSNSGWSWIVKRQILLNKITSISDIQDGAYYHYNGYYYGAYQWNLDDLGNGEIIRIRIVPQASSGKQITTDLINKNIYLLDSGNENKIASFLIGKINFSKINLLGINQSDDTESPAQIRVYVNNSGLSTYYGNYLIKDINNLLNEDFIFTFSSQINDKNDFSSYIFSSEKQLIGTKFPSNNNPEFYSDLVLKSTGEIGRINIKAEYYINYLTILKYPFYEISSKDNLILYSKNTHEIQTTNYTPYYQSPTYPTLSMIRGRIGVNYSELSSSNASLNIYPLLDSQNYDLNNGGEGIKEIIRIVANDSYYMNRDTEKSAVGNYLGFFFTDEGEDFHYGSIGFDKDGKAYLIITNSGSDAIKTRIATQLDLDEINNTINTVDTNLNNSINTVNETINNLMVKETSIISIEHGGTNADNALTARENLRIRYGTTEPSDSLEGEEGDIYFWIQEV